VSRVGFLLLCGAAALCLAACSSTGGETIKIDARQVQGWRYMPDEISEMLYGLGYDWVPIADPNSRREVKTAEVDGEYRMRFAHVAGGQANIDVRIRRKDGFTRLHFYEPARQTLSASSRQLLQELQERVTLEFGPANISF
jgi:hypothetical protein